MTPILACNIPRFTTCRRKSAGFTLLEILLVLTILGMASVLVVPNLGNLETRTFSAQARGATSLLNYARRTAVVQGQPVTATFYAADIDLTELPAARPNAGNWQAGTNTKLRFQDSTGLEFEVDDSLAIRFFPEGGSTGGVLTLQQDDAKVVIEIDPFTGRVTTVEDEN